MSTRKHLFYASIAALALGLCCTGCTTSTSLMNKSLLQGTAKNNEAALELTKYLNKSDNTELRCWALRSLSYFSAVPDETIVTLEKIITNSRSGTEIAWAAYVLGQLQRKEAVSYFFETLKQKPGTGVDYYVLEALARQISVFNDDPDLSIDLLTALNSYISQTDHTPPTMYSLLDEYVSTLTNLVRAMESLLNQYPEDKRNQKANEELYAGIFKLFNSIDHKREQLLADFGNSQLGLEKAFTTAYKSLDESYKPAYLLYSWYSGELGNNPELAEIASEALIPWVNHSDPQIRQLVIWSLLRTEIYSSTAKKALLEHISKTETNPDIINMMAAYSNIKGQPDAIQQLLGIEVQ